MRGVRQYSLVRVTRPPRRAVHAASWRLTALVAGVALVASGCSASTAASGPAASDRPATFVQIADADIPMPAVAAGERTSSTRIVSLATGVAETVVALGAADRLVGRDESSRVDAISDVPVVTKAHAVNAEQVLALAPDLVLIDAATAPQEAIDRIADAGIEIVTVPEAWSLDDMDDRIRAVARAVGASTAQLDAVLATIPAPTTPAASGPRVAFLYLRGTSAIYLLGGKGSGADAMIAAAGGVDVGAEAGLDAFTPLTAEALASLKPDVLLVMTKGLESVGGVEGLVALPGVAQTPAGREGRVIAVEDTLLLAFGPRTGPLVDRLRAALDEVAP